MFVGEHAMEEYGTVKDVYQVFVILGGDNGIEGFCLPNRTVERKRRKQNINHLNFIQSWKWWWELLLCSKEPFEV